MLVADRFVLSGRCDVLDFARTRQQEELRLGIKVTDVLRGNCGLILRALAGSQGTIVMASHLPVVGGFRCLTVA